MNKWNPNGELLDRPVPDGIELDVPGLVESWVAEAEDWLMAYTGQSTQDSPADGLKVREQQGDYDRMTSREAFEGIECLGRLLRCRQDLIRHCEGEEILQQLSCVLDENNPQFVAELALDFADLDAWRRQAQAVWDEDVDDYEATDQLLVDLDAADFLSWFIEQQNSPTLTESDAFARFEKQLVQCHLWLGRRKVMFIESEALIRAIAKTIASDLNDSDPSGSLTLSTVKYVTLLDQCEAAWKDATAVPRPDFILKQPRYGRLKADYRIAEAASAAGASQQFIAPKIPIQWHDPNGKFEATAFLPDAIVPGADTLIEISFGKGEHFGEAAVELIGIEIQLGSASAVIKSRAQGCDDFVFAFVRLQAITVATESTIELIVNGERWE